MSFEEVQFPKTISYGSLGGPGFQTKVKTLTSGFEQRNQKWPYPRHEYNVAYGVKKAEQLKELIAFFNSMNGRAVGFRYNDPLDHSTSALYDGPTGNDVTLIGSAAGSEQNDIQLFKEYTSGTRTVTRPITKPITGSVTIYIDNVLQPSGWTLDYTTGLLSLDAPLTVGQKLSWGGEFDVPCRFATDTLQISLVGDIVGKTNIPVKEIRVA